MPSVTPSPTNTPVPNPPVTTALLSPTPNAAGWNRTAVTIQLDVSGGSGLVLTYYAIDNTACAETALTQSSAYSQPLTPRTDGPHTITFFSADPTDGFEASHTQLFKIDQLPPNAVTLASQGGSLGSGGFYTTPPSLTLAATDATSGVQALYFQF